MLDPDFLESATDRIVQLYRQLEDDIVNNMARMVGNADYALPSLDWQQYVYTQIQGNQKDLIRRIAKVTGLSVKEVRKVFKRAGIESTSFDNAIYQQAYDAGLISMPPVGLLKSPHLMGILEGGIRATNKTLENFTRSIAANTNVQLKDALDRTYFQVSTGAVAYNQAIRQTVIDLTAQGVGKITYPSGVRNNLDVVVRRAVLSGINVTCGKMAVRQMQDMDCEYVETTAHVGARDEFDDYRNHQKWQGKIFLFDAGGDANG